MKPVKFSTTQKLLHYIIFIGFFAQSILIGFKESDYFSELVRKNLMNYHKSNGIVLLFLGLTFIIVRLIQSRPEYPLKTKWELVLSKTVHGILWISIIWLPLTGFMMALTSKWPLHFYNFFEIPKIFSIQTTLSNFFHSLHIYAIPVYFFALVLHILGVLKHFIYGEKQFLDLINLTGSAEQSK